MRQLASNKVGTLARAFVLTAIFLALSLFFSTDIFANEPTLLQKVQAEHFRDPGQHRLGLEVEVVGVEVEDVLRLAQEHLGGQYTMETTPEGLSVGTLKNSRVGDLIVKHETNQTGERRTPRKSWVVELVTQPLYFNQVEPFHRLVQALPQIGARGTLDDNQHPVSTQVNLEIVPKGFNPREQVDVVLSLLRFYLNEQNIRQIRREQKIPEKRMRFLGPFSKGFMAKLNNAHYKPTARELYDDFFYRQSAEILGHNGAWTEPLSAIQIYIRALPQPLMVNYPQLAKIVKLQSVRISSWLMLMFPDDWFSQMILNEEWAKPHPILEFRDWNNNFDVLTPVKEVVALYFMAQKNSQSVGENACLQALKEPVDRSLFKAFKISGEPAVVF